MNRFPVSLVIPVFFAILFCCTCNETYESPEITKLAVLPFSSVNKDTLYQHVGKGLTYDLISRLSCQRELSVRSFGAVKNIDLQISKLPELRNQLDMEYLIEGKYKIDHDSLKLDLELTRFPEGDIISTMNFRVSMESLSRMPIIVSREIVSEISKKFHPASVGNASSYASSDSDAYQFFLKAIAADPKNARDWAECIKLLEQSVKIDSIFEPSWTFLGHSYLEYSGLVGGEAGFYSRAEESLVRALELNEESPDAMYYLASLYAKTGKSEASYNMFLKGSQKYRGYAEYFSGLGYVSRYAGKMEESIDAYHKSIGLDSSLKNIVSARMQILKSQIYLGKYREANHSFEIVRKTLEAQGKIPDEKQLFYAGVINMYLEDTLTAIRYFDLSYDNDPGSIWSGFGLAYKAALMNQGEDLAELLISFESRDIIDGERRYRMVHFYTLGGNYEKALEHLEHSVNGGFFNYPYIVNDPLTINLRETERFKDISGAAYSRYVNFPEG